MNHKSKSNKEDLIYSQWKFEIFIDNKVFNISKNLYPFIDDKYVLERTWEIQLATKIATRALDLESIEDLEESRFVAISCWYALNDMPIV